MTDANLPGDLHRHMQSAEAANRQRAQLMAPAFEEEDLREYLHAEFRMYQSLVERNPNHRGRPLPSVREIHRQFGGGFTRIQRIKHEVEVELQLREATLANAQGKTAELSRKFDTVTRRLTELGEDVRGLNRRTKRYNTMEAAKLRREKERAHSTERAIREIHEVLSNDDARRPYGSAATTPMTQSTQDVVTPILDAMNDLAGHVNRLGKQVRERHVSHEAAGEEIHKLAQRVNERLADEAASDNRRVFDSGVAKLNEKLDEVVDRVRAVQANGVHLDDYTEHFLGALAIEQIDAGIEQMLVHQSKIVSAVRRMRAQPVTLNDYSLTCIAAMHVLHADGEI